MNYFILIPCVLISSGIYAYLSHKTNTASSGWLFALYVYGGLIQPWVIVSKFSTNIILDSIIYDMVMVFSYFAVLWYLGCGEKIGNIGIAGITLIFLGFILMKYDAIKMVGR